MIGAAASASHLLRSAKNLNMETNHHLILVPNVPQPLQDLLCRFGVLMDPDAAEHLIHLACSEVDASHHSYIEAKIVWKDRTDPLPVRISHRYVAAIFDFDDPTGPIGFQ